ncbi:MAG: DUF2470 domain-containing protein [Acidobacteriota bacterium]
MAARAALADDPAALTRSWLLTTTSATLCTTAVHREVAGFPFGSVVPFALDQTGRPVILTATIATHTANLRQDPRGSLLVRQPGLEGDPQTGWRVTLMGTWAPVSWDHPDVPEIAVRYRERVPAADGYRKTHDFAFWRMEEIRKVRYIAGFGKICWFDGAQLVHGPDPALSAAADAAVAHMNDDHPHNLHEMVEGLHGVTAERVEMTGLARDGFFVRTEQPDHTLFFPFHRDIDASTLRVAVIDVLKRARDARGPTLETR